jgi:hypothetical protein
MGFCLNAGDQYLAYFSRSTALAVGESYTVNKSVKLPASFEGNGLYQILFIADIGNTQPEANESDNILAVPITVHGADLVAMPMTILPSEASLGDTVRTTVRVENHGDLAAAGHAEPGYDGSGWFDAWYLSADMSLDADDQPVLKRWRSAASRPSSFPSPR